MIIYLHGFSSGSASRKATLLQQGLSPIPMIVPDYPSYRPRDSIMMLTQLVSQQAVRSKGEQLLLIGSSLGGYYAQYLAHTLDVVDGLVLINPALQPQLTLQPYVGQQTNMVTGERFDFSLQCFDELALYSVAENEIHCPTLVLLDEGDELIDCHYAAHHYQHAGRVIVYPGGSHWFDHLADAMPEIRSFYQSLH